MQTTCGWGGGEVELCCRPYYAGVLHSISDQNQNLQNCFTTSNKMASKDDIKGLVSLKFPRPWLAVTKMGRGRDATNRLRSYLCRNIGFDNL